jgi:oligosaccharide repeat unit polymerase
MPDLSLIPWSALYWIDAIAVAHFLISYYRNCYRKGYRIDFWHSQLFLICVLPNMLMLPFAKSELNTIVVGKDMGTIIQVLPTVFLITLVGYLAVLAGGGLWRLRAGLGLRKAAFEMLNLIPRCSMMLMSSRDVLVFQAALCVVFQWLVLAYYFSQSGFAFDLRGYTFANPSFRPVALLISNYSVIIGSHCLARYVDGRERVLLFCTMILSLGLVFFGARGNLAAIYFPVLLCYVVMLRTRIGLFRIITVGAIIVVVVFYLGNVRAGDYSLAGFFGSLAFLLLYGNNFSDLRDFAWVYSAWDHVFWGGKTYLVAILSFMPRFASSFRNTWAIGAMTTSTIGQDPEVFGLRPGSFGEGFFNFGVLGVIAVGLVVGIIVRRVDLDTKRVLTASPPSMMKAFASTMLLGVSATVAITAGFSGLYVLGGVYLFAWLCQSVERVFRPKIVAADHVG